MGLVAAMASAAWRSVPSRVWGLALPISAGAGTYALSEEPMSSALFILWWHLSFWISAAGSPQFGWVGLGMCAIVGVVIPCYGVTAMPVRFMYGMASLTHGLRLLQLVCYPQYFKGSTWEFRLAYVHWYHDLREATVVDADSKHTGRGRENVSWIATQGVVAGIVACLVGNYMALTTPTVTAIFLCGVLAVDAVYRLLLAFNHVHVPCTVQQPWAAETLREFWSSHWNRVIQRMLKESVYTPLRGMGWPRHVAATSTFFVSGALHAYPLMLMGMETRHGVQMLGFFLLQPALMAFENAMGIKGRWWVMVSLLLTLPLFAYPVIRVTRGH